MRTATAATTTAMLRECRNRCQRQRAEKHQRRTKFQMCRSLCRKARRVNFFCRVKLLRGLVHVVSLHPTGRLKGDTTSSADSSSFYTNRPAPAPIDYFKLQSFYKSPAAPTFGPPRTMTLYCFR